MKRCTLKSFREHAFETLRLSIHPHACFRYPRATVAHGGRTLGCSISALIQYFRCESHSTVCLLFFCQCGSLVEER